MRVLLVTAGLLTCSDVFMTFAWPMSLAQLKVLQEVITLSVFVPFAVIYMRQPMKLDFLWAGLCLMGAVYFIFRS